MTIHVQWVSKKARRNAALRLDTGRIVAAGRRLRQVLDDMGPEMAKRARKLTRWKLRKLYRDLELTPPTPARDEALRLIGLVVLD